MQETEAPRGLLLDIEGTTTPVRFVYDVLFPYARARLRPFLEAHGRQGEAAADLARLREEHRADVAPGRQPPPWPDGDGFDGAVAYLEWLMDRDVKSTGLKALQGRIWEEGYRSGQLRGEVYADVPPALRRWRDQRRSVAIFSSGSVQAQQLLFRHSTAGDLTSLVRSYFDTTTGPKREPASYEAIARALGREPSALLFLSDVGAELDAAAAAGLLTALCVREGEGPEDGGGHDVIRSFDEVRV